MRERWKGVVGYEGLYAVSDRGRVKSKRLGRLLKPRVKRKRYDSRGYFIVELSRGGVSRRPFVHTLVLTAFRGLRQVDQECRHLDGDPHNNRLGNLVWGSYRENRADWHKHHKRIKLTPDLVRYIRGSEKSLRELAGELGVCRTTVAHARGYWGWV